MNYKNSKHIRNRRIGESEVELLYGVFSKFGYDGNKGRVCVTVKGAEFGEFCSDDRSALDAMKVRRKPVSEIEFSYRNVVPVCTYQLTALMSNGSIQLGKGWKMS